MNMLQHYFTSGIALVALTWYPLGGAQYDNCTGVVDLIANGWCDHFNNKESCSYDGGDCCPCSCIDGPEYECGSNGFDCADEGCVDSAALAQLPNCTGVLLKLADGTCDEGNNSPECGYDGGDCCMCTCIDSISCTFDFACVDPFAGNELYACEIASAVFPPCSTEVEQIWVVEDSAQARALAESSNCSGGSFHVEWRGNIAIDETIYVVDGTVLRISGYDTNAVMTGNLEGRLITVVNASLHLRDMSVKFGSSLVGGAIAASASSLTLNHTSFLGNHADGTGGALYIINGSRALFNGDYTAFSSNTALGSGGALYVAGGSVVSWKGRKTSFTDNVSDLDGGAVTIRAGSIASWTEEVLFSNNTCERYGGAVYTTDYAIVDWNGKTDLSNNSAGAWGGAVMVVDGSNVSCGAEMAFGQNVAGQFGGGLYVGSSSSFSWSGETSFADNRAGISGGAMVIAAVSVANGSGATFFTQNSADEGGGAVHVIYNSTIVWGGETVFTSNIAGSRGGALIVEQGSQAVWSEKAAFTNNSARDSGRGGALYEAESSIASFKSETSFARNSASSGGAVCVTDYSTVFYDGHTIFDSNGANSGQGGGLSSSYSNVYWGSKTTFVGNMAVSFGGAVAFIAELSTSDHGPSLVFAGPTVFMNNTCETNGGALGLIGGVSVTMKTPKINFSGNSAEVAGGAIYMWGADVGPEFIGMSVTSNYAQHGAGVFSTGSGNALIDVDGERRANPVVFKRCSFVENQAIATGGAIQSAAGQDEIVDTIFMGNRAAEGGALNLAGTTLLVNCSFLENISDEGGGPVVSNIGYVSDVSNCSFLDNACSCELNRFLDYNASDDLFEVICKGCEEPCKGCYFQRPFITPVCTKAMENAFSPGGSTTMDLLLISPGYWRATTSSKEILSCYNPKACLGGLTGEPGFCLEGYEGPYCAICSYGYSASLGFTCNRCSDSTVGIVIAATFALAILAAVIYIPSYLISAERASGTKIKAFTERLLSCIPVQSVKVVIVAWQIVIQFVSVANVQYPHVYQRFLDGVKLLNFDLGWVLSASCVVPINFHDRLLLATIGPVVVMALLGVTYTIAVRRNRRSREAVENVRHKHLFAALLVTFLVYANVSSILFQTFACEHLEDGNFYLRADYRIECNSIKHKKLQVYAGFMIFLYVVGIPAFYATVLFKNRDVLKKDETFRSNCSCVSPTSSLWRPYKPSVFYFEVIECARRVLLVGVVVFFEPNTASQIAVTLMLAFAFAIVSESLDPYATKWDTWLSRTGHVVVVVSVYLALLLKVDVSTERDDSQQTFEAVLVLVNGCMIAAIVIEAVVMASSLECWYARERADSVVPDSHPRFRSMRWPVGRKVSVAQNGFIP